MKKSWLICILMMLCLLSGCEGGGNRTIHGELFYNPYIQKLVVYDQDSKEVSLFDDTSNQFQFHIDGSDDLFIDGNSISNVFRIIQINQSQVTELYKFDKNHGIFPIGVIGEKLYFIHSFYDQNGQEQNEKRCISIFNMNTYEIENYTRISGLISYGCMNDDNIFCTLYDNNQNNYTLVSIKTGDLNAMPELICENISDGIIMMEGNNLFYSDGQFLISDKDKYEIKSENLIYQKFLIQFYISQDGLLCIKVINMETKEVFDEKDICGIRFDKGNLLICKQTGVITYEQ